jgi:hypothetical protein
MWLMMATGCTTTPSADIVATVEPAPVKMLDALLALDAERDVAEIAAMAERLVTRAKPLTEQVKADRRARKKDLAALPYPAVRAHFHPPSTNLGSHEIRGVEEVVFAARKVLQDREANRSADLTDLREVMEALRNDRRSPIPSKAGALSPWKHLVQNSRRSIGHGTTPATNLVACPSPDLSRCDPEPSGFWTVPPEISVQDLAAGFGRSALPRWQHRIWEYDNPKTSSGTRPGFEAELDDREFKIKLAEASSESFTARIFHALGYHVDPTDYVSELKLRYDRRFFREFNLRKRLTMRLEPFWIPVGKLELQPYYDPFQFVQAAVFKDGTRLSGPDLKSILLTDPAKHRGEEEAASFRTEIEHRIDYLIVGPANIQSKQSEGESIGCWDFKGLGHEHRRELRGAGLLAAWLGWFDARFDNTRLRVMDNRSHPRLQYYFSDLGSGLGRGTGRFVRHGEDARAMEWVFTSPEVVRGPGRMTTPFRVINYQTIVPTRAFQEMTIDDARWMARLIAKLTESQITAALAASGYSAADIELYRAKLLQRRERMLRDLGLSEELERSTSRRAAP